MNISSFKFTKKEVHIVPKFLDALKLVWHGGDQLKSY